MATKTVIGTKIQQAETANLTAVVRDSAGAVVDLTGADVDIFLSNYNNATNAGINGRTNQQVVTAGVASNDHTVDASGNLTWKLTTSDTALAGSADETHTARYTIEFDDGAAVQRTAIHEIEYIVEALPTIT